VELTELKVTYTIAYYITELITAVKSFRVQVHAGPNVIKIFVCNLQMFSVS